MVFVPGTPAISKIKPPMWAVTPGLIAPEWGWFWRDAVFVVPLWEGSNSLPRDIATATGSQSLSGTFSGNAAWSVGPRGWGIDFGAGANDRVDFGAVNMIGPKGAPLELTVEILVRIDGTSSDQGLIANGKKGSPEDFNWLMWWDKSASESGRTNTISFQVGDATNAGAHFTKAEGSNSVPTSGKFHHIVGRYRQTPETVSLFIDGIFDQKDTLLEGIIPSETDTFSLQLGAADSAIELNGAIALAVIYWKYLSEAEILQRARDIFGPFRMNLGYTAVSSAPVGAGILSLTRPSISATAVMHPDGAGALALAVPLIAGTGLEKFTASGAIALPVPTVSGAGVGGAEGAGALALAVPVIAGTGVEKFTVSGALALPVPIIAGTGVAGAEGVGALALGPPIVSASAVEEFIASGALALAVPIIAGTGTHVDDAPAGSGALALGVPVIIASAVEEFTASGALALGVPAISASAIEEFIATGGLTIARPSIAGTGAEKFIATGALIIARPGISADAIEQLIASGALLVPVPAINGVAVMQPAGTGVLTIAALVINASGAVTTLFGVTPASRIIGIGARPRVIGVEDDDRSGTVQ